MHKIEAKLHQMGYTLPEPFVYPRNNRRGWARSGNVLYLSGHGLGLQPLPGVRTSGRFGVDITEEEGYATARATALQMLASIKQAVGDLDRVTQVIRIFGMCKCTPEFMNQPQVIDGASDLFFELFGPVIGVHARTAVGMYALPKNISLEINGEFEVSPDPV